MWRAFFLAIGIYCFLLGVEAMVVERAIVAPSGAASVDGFAERTSPSGMREIAPPDWAPWSLMSAGAVVMLYSFTVPKRMTKP